MSSANGKDFRTLESDDRRANRTRFSLASLLTLLALVALASAYLLTLSRLREARSELADLRRQLGYLAESSDDEIAAVRLTSDQPLTYRMRVRVPASPPYRIAYSSFWPQSQTSPDWLGAVHVPPGESMVVVRITKDIRDDRWKIVAIRQSSDGSRRMATALPESQVEIFRGSHDWLRSGVSQETVIKPAGESIRILDERVLVGEGAMMLYGDRPPTSEMVGVFAELQPDLGPI